MGYNITKEQKQMMLKFTEDQLLAKSRKLEVETKKYNYLSKLKPIDFKPVTPAAEHEVSPEFCEIIQETNIANTLLNIADMKEHIGVLSDSIESLKLEILKDEVKDGQTSN